MNVLQQLSQCHSYVSITHGKAILEDGTRVDLVDALAKQNELLAALRETLRAIQDGSCSETQNPYTRPYVRRALIAIKEFTGFKGDWSDANPLPPTE